MLRRSLERGSDTDHRHTCPWCGLRFTSTLLMQAHEPECPDRWLPDQEGDDGVVHDRPA